MSSSGAPQDPPPPPGGAAGGPSPSGTVPATYTAPPTRGPGYETGGEGVKVDGGGGYVRIHPKEGGAAVQSSSLPHDAPLQLRRDHDAPHAKYVPYRTRIINFVRRNRYPLAFCAFVYAEFVGFPIVRVAAQDDKHNLALRRRGDGKTVHLLEYRPPMKPQELQRVGAFSIVDKQLPDAKGAIVPAQVDRPPFEERMKHYFFSYFPNPFFSRVDPTPDGQNALQYNRLFYYVTEYGKRKYTYLPIDAKSADDRISAHMAVKIVYRTQKVIIPDENPGHPGTGFDDPMLETFAKEELTKWVRLAGADDLRHSPQWRLESSLQDSLAGWTDEDMRRSVERSTLEHKRRIVAIESAASEEDRLAATEMELPPEALDATETLRRVWASTIFPRLKGKALIEDVLWKTTLTEMVQDNSHLDFGNSHAWTY